MDFAQCSIAYVFNKGANGFSIILLKSEAPFQCFYKLSYQDLSLQVPNLSWQNLAQFTLKLIISINKIINHYVQTSQQTPNDQGWPFIALPDDTNSSFCTYSYLFLSPANPSHIQDRFHHPNHHEQMQSSHPLLSSTSRPQLTLWLTLCSYKNF